LVPFSLEGSHDIAGGTPRLAGQGAAAAPDVVRVPRLAAIRIVHDRDAAPERIVAAPGDLA